MSLFDPTDDERVRDVHDTDAYDDSGQPYCRLCGDIGHSSNSCPDR